MSSFDRETAVIAIALSASLSSVLLLLLLLPWGIYFGWNNGRSIGVPIPVAVRRR
jgi:hypothetical protein